MLLCIYIHFSTMEVEWIDGTVICLDGEMDVSIGSNVDHKHFSVPIK